MNYNRKISNENSIVYIHSNVWTINAVKKYIFILDIYIYLYSIYVWYLFGSGYSFSQGLYSTHKQVVIPIIEHYSELRNTGLQVCSFHKLLIFPPFLCPCLRIFNIFMCTQRRPHKEILYCTCTHWTDFPRYLFHY